MILMTDLSEVLIKGVCGMENYVRESYGDKVAKRFLKRRGEISSIFCELLRGHISEDIYWHVFLQEGKWPFGVAELKAIFSYNMAEEIPGTLSVYRRIIGYPDSIRENATRMIGRPEIWLVSDHVAEREIELEYLHPEIFSLTSKQIWSFNRSKIKLDTGFFDDLLSKYHLAADEVIFIDDLFENVYSASDVGISTIVFENANQLEDRLSQLGFVFADTAKEPS